MQRSMDAEKSGGKGGGGKGGETGGGGDSQPARRGVFLSEKEIARARS